MLKSASALSFCVFALLVPAVCLAQGKPISFFFRPCNDQPLNDAITAAVTQPPFVLATREMPGALVISIPDKVEVERKVSGTSWSFNVAFSRDGQTLGQSAESCGNNKLSDCTDQLQSDVRSAAGMAQ